MKKSIILIVIITLVASMFVGCSQGEAAGKSAILVVSFGTSYADTRAKTIDAMQERITNEYPDMDTYKAFTAQTIIDILEERDQIDVWNVEEALTELAKKGYEHVYVQPLHIINGEEYENLATSVKDMSEKFKDIRLGAPLLTSVADYENTVTSLQTQFGERQEGQAVILMGHGTHHFANASYPALQYYFNMAGMNDVYVGTVENKPFIEEVIEQIKDKNYTSVKLVPLMLVAGDHASNDMAGDEEDSWKMVLKNEGYDVEIQLVGLGENLGIQSIFMEHLATLISGNEE